jgi:hypothetical protein
MQAIRQDSETQANLDSELNSVAYDGQLPVATGLTVTVVRKPCSTEDRRIKGPWRDDWRCQQIRERLEIPSGVSRG